jgi:hypothetical protein
MDYFIGAFGVFYVYSLANRYLTMPRWSWSLLLLLLSVGAWYWINPHQPWRIFGIAGIATLIKGTEALLLVTTDRGTVGLLRDRR